MVNQDEIAKIKDVVENKILEKISVVLLDRFKLHSFCEDFKINSIKKHDVGTKVFKNKMAMILIAGRNLRYTIKVHFDHADLKKIAASVYGIDIEKVDERKTIDFMKEYCNLVGGQFKKIFSENNISVGISLPFYTRGFYEVFYELPDTELSFTDHFVLSFDETSFVISVTQEYFDTSEIDQIASINIESKQEDEEIDFL